MSKDRLIVFFPGWGDPVSVLRPMAKRFEKEGYETFVVKHPGGHGTRMPISELVESAIKSINPIVGSKSWDDVIFLGHSMGGLIARNILSTPQSRDAILVTLAAPHQGTTVANRMPASIVKTLSPSAYDMIPGSDYLRRLESLTGALDGIPKLSVSGQYEELVRPPRTTKFGDRHIIIPNMTHATLPLAFRTFAEIYAWLTYEVFDELG